MTTIVALGLVLLSFDSQAAVKSRKSKLEKARLKACNQLLSETEDNVLRDLIRLKKSADKFGSQNRVSGIANPYLSLFEEKISDAAKKIKDLRKKLMRGLAESKKIDDSLSESDASTNGKLERVRKIALNESYNYHISRANYWLSTDWAVGEKLSELTPAYSTVQFRDKNKGLIDVQIQPKTNEGMVHTKWIFSAVQVGPSELLTASNDHSAILWEVNSSHEAIIKSVLGVPGNEDPKLGHVDAVDFARRLGENEFVTASWDNTALWWTRDPASNEIKIKTRFGLPFNEDISRGHVGYVTSIQIAKLATNPTETSEVFHEDEDSNLEFLTTSNDHTAILWVLDSKNDARIAARFGEANGLDPNLGHTSFVSTAQKVGEREFLTTSWDHTAILWELDSSGIPRMKVRFGVAGNKDPELGHIRRVNAIQKVDDNKYLTVSDDHTAILWKINRDGIAVIMSRLGRALNDENSVGHSRFVVNSRFGYLNGALIIETLDESGRSIVWGPELNEYGILKD